GMGRDLYQASPAARAVFQTADRVLGFPLSTLCFEGPEEELRRTVNTQPAIMAVSLAALAAARESGPAAGVRPAFVAGHSLGEYTALVAAGALDLETGLRLVRERGRLMQEAGERNPGTMAAIIGLEEEAVAALCREAGAELCNLNGGGQIAVGGPEAAVARAMELARERGAARAVPLNVGGAFHTSLMAPAAEGMRRAVAEVQFRDPAVPVVANCTARPLTTAEEVRQELVDQLCSAVQWERSVRWMTEAGVTTFWEIGPGRVLAGLIRRIAGKGVDVVNLGTAEAVQRLG
ncbi:MAG TPA: ACP S-malonyltransferase, partial [Dehalococcoidia bacterium]